MSQYLCLFCLILQGLHKEGECRQLEFWAGKGANIRDLFCTSAKVLKLHGSTFQNIYKILGERSNRGGPPTVHEGGGAPYPPGRAPCLVGPLTLHRAQLQLHIFVFGEKKIREKDSSRFMIRSRRQALNSLGRADLESVRGSGEGNPSPSSSSTILHHQFHYAHRCA